MLDKERFMVDYDNPNNYVQCQKKSYIIRAYAPEKGTVVINKLEQWDTVQFLGGSTFISPDEMEKDSTLKEKVTKVLEQGRGYLITDDLPFVILGTVEELMAVDSETLINKYTIWYEDKFVPITPELLKERLLGDRSSWKALQVQVDSSKAWACFVPVSQKGQITTSEGSVLNFNDEGVDHEKGDYIIAQDDNGKPNLSDRYVVNGGVFVKTYTIGDEDLTSHFN